MTEYWLQKKTIGGWSNVTWYSDEAQAKANYATLRKGVGYSYRLCKVEVVEEHLLEEVVDLYPHQKEALELVTAKANVWGTQRTTNNNGWSDTANGWNNNVSVNVVKSGWEQPKFTTPMTDVSMVDGGVKEHGMTGKVWLIHHGNKEKKRVDPSEVDGMIANGWERGGPKTAFRI